jgi:perosamine synthetase
LKNYIPLHEPQITQKDTASVKDAVNTGWVTTSGKYIIKFKKLISKFTGCKNVNLLINGTSALHIALKVVGVKPGDEVIVQTTTFVATINSIIYNSANPIFMDCDEYLNISEDKTLDFLKTETIFRNGNTLNKKTKKIIRAIIIVHTYGKAAKFEKLLLFCRKRNIKIVEDAAESLGTYYLRGRFKNKHTGTVGDIGCFSFNGNKIITSGGGGAIITNNKIYSKKVNYLINQAKNNPVKFIHNSIGYNYAMSNINAALGCSQLERINKIIYKKEKIYNQYLNNLKNSNICELMKNPTYSKNNNWLNIIFIKKANVNSYINKFKKKKIFVRPLWFLNHLQKPFKKYQTYKIKYAPKLYPKVLCLPSSYNIKYSELKKIIRLLDD